MREKIILNIEKPLLRTWSSESHLMSMILSQDNAMEWIFNNYINLLGYHIPSKNQNLLAFFPKHNPMDSDMPINAWTACPFLDVYMVSPVFFKNIGILEYVLQAINNGYYVYLSLCQDYLKVRLNTQIHKTFIYGFDKTSGVLYAADHYDVMKYSLAEIGFDEFVKAYNAAYLEVEKNIFDFKNNLYETQFVVLAKSKSSDYVFNRDWFKIQLKDYLNSTYSLDCIIPLTVEEDVSMYLGIKSYDLLLDYMDGMLNDRTLRKDWRIFTLICDHKNLLMMRMDYFQKNGIVNFTKEELEEYKKLHKSAQFMLNMFLKNTVTDDTANLKKIIDICVNMKVKELDLLSHLLKKIE